MLKMEENIQHFQHIMLYYFMKVKDATEREKKDLCCVWRRCCDGLNVSNRFAKFRAGDSSLDEAPRSGRPVEVDSDQIETLIENNQCSTTWERADILKISRSMKLLVDMKNVSFILQKKP